MELSNEDQLRLNVLLANPMDAIRIDEASMTVCGLTGTTEAKVRLHPNARAAQYLRHVRELLSGHVLGSPGGYPAYLQRWTRMGQMRDARLAELLMLGDPEAVVAVAGAAGLTHELARRAWWALPTADNARCMLERRCVVEGSMGKVLASYLVEYLPFETDAMAMIETVRRVLQPGLIDDVTLRSLWSKGKSKSALLIGFLLAQPDALPDPLPARADAERHTPLLAPLAQAGNVYAALLMRTLSGGGQTFLHVAQNALRRPSNQDAAVSLLNAIGGYFKSCQPQSAAQNIEAMLDTARITWLQAVKSASPYPGLNELVAAAPELERETLAVLALSQVNENLLNSIFARSTAIGTVMSKKIEPVVTPILQQFAVLRGEAG